MEGSEKSAVPNYSSSVRAIRKYCAPIKFYSVAYSWRGLGKMRVNVHYVGLVRNFTNRSEDEFNLPDGASLLDLLNKLAGTYGKSFEKEIFEPGLKDLKANFVATVNGALMGQLGGIEACLNNNDNVVLMSLMTGG